MQITSKTSEKAVRDIDNVGSDIDNWSIAELEVMVELFKRSLDQPETSSKFKVQSIDLYDEDDEIYVKRIKCTKREPSLLGEDPHSVKIKQ